MGVDLTKAGRVTLQNTRARANAILGTYLAETPDQNLEALAAATETLTQLITVLQQGPIK